MYRIHGVSLNKTSEKGTPHARAPSRIGKDAAVQHAANPITCMEVIKAPVESSAVALCCGPAGACHAYGPFRTRVGTLYTVAGDVVRSRACTRYLFGVWMGIWKLRGGKGRCVMYRFLARDVQH